MDVAAKLRPLADRLKALSRLVEDTILQAQGRAWQSTTAAYTMLVRLVGRFPALQSELEPMASLMASRHKNAPQSLRKKPIKKRATKHAKPEPTAVTPPPAQASPPATAKPAATS